MADALSPADHAGAVATTTLGSPARRAAVTAALTQMQADMPAEPMPRLQHALDAAIGFTDVLNAADSKPGTDCSTSADGFLVSPVPGVRLRRAGADDAPAIHALIQELAEYEKEPDAVKTTPDQLRRDGFGAAPAFYVVLAFPVHDGTAPCAMALCHSAYSTWQGQQLYLEDLYVRPSHRRLGLGSLLIQALARAAFIARCGRLLFQVLDWNRPAIDCYTRLGGHVEAEWLTVRLHRPDVAALCEGVTTPTAAATAGAEGVTSPAAAAAASAGAGGAGVEALP